MNKDIRLSTTFFSHRKTKKLKRILGYSGVVALLTLWARVAVERPTGILEGWSDEDIALEADFEDDPVLFVSTLADVGFLDKIESGWELHNWGKRQGWVAKSAQRSDKARLLRMAKTHNRIYRELVEKGFDGISRRQYEELTSIKRPVNGTLNAALTPAPAPAPDPEPYQNQHQNLTSTSSFPSPTSYKETSSTSDECPHQKIIELYHNLCPMLPRVLEWTAYRQKMLRTRWNENKDRQDLDWWKNYFIQVSKSDYLTGKVNEFQASLEWLVRPKNMPKVIEGFYVNRAKRTPPIVPRTMREADAMKKEETCARLLGDDGNYGSQQITG